jgi:hypothetical protein
MKGFDFADYFAIKSALNAWLEDFRGDLIRENAATIAAPQVPAVDVSSAPQVMMETYAGVPARRRSRISSSLLRSRRPKSAALVDPQVLLPQPGLFSRRELLPDLLRTRGNSVGSA